MLPPSPCSEAHRPTQDAVVTRSLNENRSSLMAQQAPVQQPQQGAVPASPQMGGAKTVTQPQPARPVYNDWAAI